VKLNKRIFFIAGMHRSGTSYLSQTLGVMGLELPVSIQPGAADNLKGHFESLSIAQYHDYLLSELNLSWDTFISPPEGWFSSEYATIAIQELSIKLQSDFPGDGPVVLKDPRLSLFMPLWGDIVKKLDLEDYYIIPLRHPLAVAASLDKRDKIGKTRSFLIYLNYLFNIEKSTRQKKRAFVGFPQWSEDLELTLNNIENDLGTGFPKKNKRNITKAKKEFESTFVHHQETLSGVAHNDIESLCFETHQTFLKLIKNPKDIQVLKKLDTLSIRFDKVSSVFAEVFFELELKKEAEIEKSLTLRQSEHDQSTQHANSLQEQLTETNTQVAAIEQQLATSQSEHDQSTQQANSLQEQLTEASTQVAALEQQLATSQSEHDQSTLQANSLQEQLTEANTQVAALEQQLATSQSEHDQSTQHANSLQEQLTEASTQVAALEQQLATSQSEHDQSTQHANSLQEQLTVASTQNAVLEQQLATSQSELNDLKVTNLALTKEYGKLLTTYKKEQLTVMRPIYKNIYKSTGFLLRNTLPSAWVESIKRVIPGPNGVIKNLTYQHQFSTSNDVTVEEFTAPLTDAKPDIFVLSIINWDFRYQRPQHIAKGMSENGSRVFYVEMDLSDNSLQLLKVTDDLYRAKLSSKNIGHIQPYTGQPKPEQIKLWVTAFYELCNAVKATSFKQIIIQHPFWWQLAQHLSPEFKIIFECMDDISGFSNTDQFLLDLEHDMLQKCDKLVVSSQYLFDKYKHYQKPILIRNAAELTHFSKIKKHDSAPTFLKSLPISHGNDNTIKVGYVGAIAEWFDADIIKGAALNNTSLEFHLCGEVTIKEAAQLNDLKNINMYGEISYSDVPGFLNEMDVLIIPFKLVPIIQACDPVKFYEYSAMGKPTVTTALPELKRASKLTFVASTPMEFAEQIHNAFQAGKKRKFRDQLQEYAVNNTWKHRIAQFQEALTCMPKVTAVILSYGDPELTKSALHSLYDGGAIYPNLETIIVDNGSPSQNLEDIKNFALKYSNIKVIENNENLGFAKGNNVGLEAATGEYVLLLNNDTVVAPGAIYAMVRHLMFAPAIGVVGPLTNNIGNEAKLFVEYENMHQMKNIARQATTGYRSLSTPISVVAYFAAMFRRNDLEIFGLLSEDYGRGMFEDDDHCSMIKTKGFSCALAEDAYVHHHLSATFSKLGDGEKEALFEKNKETYEKKWGKWKPHAYREERPVSSLIGGDEI
jgi:GT2 family glycosyltransferase